MGGGDAFSHSFPLRLYYGMKGINGVFSWVPYEFLGIPFLGILQTGLLYPFNLLFFVIFPLWAFTVNDIIHPALAAFFTFSYARLTGIRAFPAFLSGVVFGFSGFIMAHKGHTSMVNSATWLPLLLVLYEKIRREPHLKYALWTSLVVAVQVFAGHYQIAVYSYLVVAFYTVYFYRSVARALKIRYLCISFLPIILGSLLSLPQLIATKELSDFSWRAAINYEYFTEYSLNPFMLIQLIFPFLPGGGYGKSPWWGWNSTELSGFTGILPLIMGLWAGVRLWRENSIVRFLVLMAMVALFLAFGGNNPLYRIMYHVPVYNLFRCPARHWLEVDLAISLLFGFGLNCFLYDLRERVQKWKLLMLLAATLVGACGFTFVGMFAVNISFLTSEVRAILTDSISFTNPAVYVPLIFLFVYVALVAIMVWKPQLQSILKNILFVFLGMVVLFEAFSFGGYHDAIYLPKAKIEEQMKNPISLFLINHARYERALFLSTSEMPLYNVPNGIHLLNGYDPFIPRGVHTMLYMWPNGASDNYSEIIRSNWIISSLNVRYVVVPRNDAPKYGIEEIKTSVASPIFIDVPLKQWNISRNVGTVETGVFSLSSPDGREVSMLSQTIALRPNTLYLLTLEARSLGKQPTGFLTFDLYGGHNYDLPDQELNVNAGEIGNEYHTFFRVINTGDNLPPKVDLRVFTFSREPVLVRHIEVKELRNFEPPYIAGEITPDKVGMPLYERVFETPEWVVYENKNCLPRAFSIARLELARDIMEVKYKFEIFSSNPAETAFVSQEDLNKIGRTRFATGNVRIESYDTDSVIIRAEFANDTGFLVLSDQYFPGWKALIDGHEAPVYQVNGLVRGVVVPAGVHTVKFVYHPIRIYIAAIISGITLAIVIGGLVESSRKI
ncbi:MAG: YfhO family protein [Thermoproteota archaeon]